MTLRLPSSILDTCTHQRLSWNVVCASHIQNLRASTVPSPSPTLLLWNPRTPSLRFVFPNFRLPETACNQQKVPFFFIYGIFEYFLPIASSNNCTVHTLWAVFLFPALYQGFFWFFCVFTSSSSSLSLLHALQTIAFSLPLPSSCFSLIPHFFFLSPL